MFKLLEYEGKKETNGFTQLIEDTKKQVFTVPAHASPDAVMDYLLAENKGEAERRLERIDSKSIILPSYVTNTLPIVASLLDPLLAPLLPPLSASLFAAGFFKRHLTLGKPPRFSSGNTTGREESQLSSIFCLPERSSRTTCSR